MGTAGWINKGSAPSNAQVDDYIKGPSLSACGVVRNVAACGEWGNEGKGVQSRPEDFGWQLGAGWPPLQANVTQSYSWDINDIAAAFGAKSNIQGPGW